MEKDTEITEVVFLIAKYEDQDEQHFETLAYFPNEDSDNKGNKTCYAHLGQHGSISKDFIRTQCRIATKDEYKDLEEELNSIGYNLSILDKIN